MMVRPNCNSIGLFYCLWLITSLANVGQIKSKTILGPGKELPEIWAYTKPHNAYHMIHRLQQSGLDESLTIEEWASFDDQLFRLDLISSETHLSYVSNGQTGEVFKYKPFTCETSIASNLDDLDTLSSLFKGYSLSNGSSIGQPMQAYGIGPLWLRARESAKHVVRIYGPGGGELEEFLVTLDDEDYKLALQFISGMLNVVEWIDTKNKRAVHVIARSKLDMYDPKEVHLSSFELPIGYGCRHGDKYKDPIRIDPTFTLFKRNSQSFSMSFDITASLPYTGADSTDWINLAILASIQRNSLIGIDGKARQYYVALSGERDFKNGGLNKTRRVWSVGFGAKRTIEYSLDSRTNECRISHQDPGHDIKILFPRLNNSIRLQEWKDLVPVWFSIEHLHALFSDNVDYHFIREETNSQDSPYLTAYYEKRIDHYEISTPDELLFNGPVSIVKKVTSLVAPAPLESAIENVHVSLVMYFYSLDLSRLEYKIGFDLLERVASDVKRIYLNPNRLFLDACLDNQDQQKSLVIKYALESAEVSKSLSFEAIEIQQEFLHSLFHLSEIPIDALQLADLNLSFDAFNMYVELTFLNLPLWQVWDMQEDTRLSESGELKNLVAKIESSLDKCSLACKHYHCQRFSYESDSFRCLLQLKEGPMTETKQGSELYVKPKSIGEAPLEAQQILDSLRESLFYENDDSDIYSRPLAISIMTDRGKILLNPTSIHSDMDSVNEFIKFEDKSSLDSNFVLEYIIYAENTQLTSGKQVENQVSYEDCAQICTEMDCRSFSYCTITGLCRLGHLHQDKELALGSEAKAGYTLFVLDYLSKFEDFGQVSPPTVVRRIVSNKSPRDCANLCIDEQDIDCQAFYHCHEPVSRQPSCMMLDKHLTEVQHKITRAKDNTSTCRLFSRSYLSQFDQYYDRELEVDSLQFYTARGIGADLCAKRCIEQSCLAFDVCHQLDKNNPESSIQCRLTNEMGIRKSHLASRKQCNTFVLSDKSQFNLIKHKLSLDLQASQKADKISTAQSNGDTGELATDGSKNEDELDTNAAIMRLLKDSTERHQDHQVDSGQTNDHSKWPMQIVILISGSFVGLVLVLVWQNSTELLESFKRIIDR